MYIHTHMMHEICIYTQGEMVISISLSLYIYIYIYIHIHIYIYIYIYIVLAHDLAGHREPPYTNIFSHNPKSWVSFVVGVV